MHSISSKWKKPLKKVSKKRSEAAKKRNAARYGKNEEEPSTSRGPNLQEEEDEEMDVGGVDEGTQEGKDEGTQEDRVPTSTRKINLFSLEDLRLSTTEESSSEEEDFFIIHKSTIPELIKHWKCPVCQTNLVITVDKKQGFAKTLYAKCSACGEIAGEAPTSPRYQSKIGKKKNPFLVNRRMVEAFSALGLGQAAGEKFGMELGMNVLSGPSWAAHLKEMEEKNEELKQEVLEEARKAVRKHHGSPEGSLYLVVSFDGSWQRRGHVSLNGVCFVIDFDSGLVLDYVVLSRYCHLCILKASVLEETSEEFKEWLQIHKESGECQVNNINVNCITFD